MLRRDADVLSHIARVTGKVAGDLCINNAPYILSRLFLSSDREKDAGTAFMMEMIGEIPNMTLKNLVNTCGFQLISDFIVELGSLAEPMREQVGS